MLAALAIVRCAAHRLPVDLRPAMAAVRIDAAAVASALDQELPQLGLEPARRLAGTPLLRDRTLPEPEFFALEDAFRAEARTLSGDLERADVAAARRSFSALTERCAECHDRFRPGGRTGAR